MENQNQPGELKRELGFWAATSIVVGCVIGSGVFVKPGIVLAAVGSSNQALFAWLLGGLISVAGGLTIAEVAARIPRTGGIYVYIEVIYGKTIGFFCGWVQTVIYGPGLMAALSLYFGLLTQPLLGLSPHAQLPLAFAALIVLVGVNCLGTRYAGKVQELTTLTKLLPIFAIAIFGWLWGGHPAVGASVATLATGSMGGAVLSTLWAYDGWMQVANVAGEMKQPARDLPRAIIVGLLTVVIAYLAVNVSLLRVLSADGVVKYGEDAARMASITLFGPWGGSLVSVGVAISIFGCLNGNILSNTRIPFAMAQRKELPYSSWIGRVHPRFGTPNNATLLQAVIAAVMILFGEVNQITDLAVFSIYIFFMLSFVGLFLLRRRDSGAARAEGAYRTPLYPWVPLIAVAGCLFMLLSKLFDQPMMVLDFGLLAGAGAPVLWWRARGRRTS